MNDLVRRAAARARLGLATLVLAAPAAAELTELDRVVAIVEDDVVLASELVSRTEMVREQMLTAGQEPPDTKVLLSQVLERLILESIQLQKGERAGVRIEDEELTRAVMGIAAQNQMSLEQFRDVLARDGMDFATFREQVRRELVIGRVQQALVNNRIQITERELDNFLNSPIGREATADEYRVGHILLAVEEGASQAAWDQARRQAREIHAELRAGYPFADMAMANSAGPWALEGGDLGWRRAGQLPTLFGEVVVGLGKGETAEPIESGSGVHIVQLLDKRGASTESVQETLVRHILVKPSEIRSEEDAEALIRDIHARLEAGEAFRDLARQYSEDPGSALSGGDLGWSEAERFVPEFAAVMRASEPEAISEPFRSQFGWHVLEVLDRRQRDLSEDYKKRMAVRYLRSRRYDEELTAWLREIRDEAYVETRI